PRAGVARHLLLGDELGLAPVNELPFRWRDRLDRSADRPRPQAVVAQERQIFAGLAENGIQRLARADVPELANAAVNSREVKLAVERNEDGLAVRGPVVGDDALEIDDTLALTLHLLGFGHRLPGAELPGIDQHRPFAGLSIERPQVVTLKVLGPV